MKYAKPEVAELATALSVIETMQGIKPPHRVTDVKGSQYALSSGAYEADE